jgi:hypothetical protein
MGCFVAVMGWESERGEANWADGTKSRSVLRIVVVGFRLHLQGAWYEI